MIGTLLHPYTLAVTTVTAGAPDADGTPTETTTVTEWGPCNVQQVQTTEERGGREVVTTRLRASGPLARWITAGDRITWDGTVYQVDGNPAHFVGGALDHTEAVLIEWKGA